jgi:hypothetical protein
VEEWSRRGLKSYPENRVFLWGLATALDRQKKPAESVSAYSDLLENILQVNMPHPYSEIVCRLNLVKTKLTVNDTSVVAYHLKKLISYENISFPDKLQSRVKAKFEEAHSLLSSLNKYPLMSK